ncbi:MAG: hypothetical protein LBP85_08515 [Prevotellaceae bacterium]|jgi:hypothetical protein|nr:hypothetical protein [Prevotellaceae bacterium]
MKNIDRFLRNIWLECCGHLSAFTTPQSHDKVPVSRNVDNVFCKGLKLEYKYGFGSRTELLLTVVEEYPVKTDDKIILLSRNEPLEWLCDTCKKKPVTLICIIHDWEEGSLFCKKCAEKHAKKCEDFSKYAAMPVVNSPHMGVCGYEGGVIDIERDVVFVKG